MMTEILNLMHIRMSVTDLLRVIGACAAAAFTYVFGGADKWLIGLAVLIAADYISGVIAAYIGRTLSSRRGLAGILKKVLLFCVVAVANIIDNATNAGGVLRSLAVGFMMANEGISVLENAARCGVRFPKRLMNALEQLRGEDVNDPTVRTGENAAGESGEQRRLPADRDGSGNAHGGSD